MRKARVSITALVVLFAVTICSFAATDYYTKFNLHYYLRGETLVSSYANYVGNFPGHLFLPVNTKVHIGRWENGFSVRVLESNQLIHFEFHAQRMGMGVKAYQKLLFSTEEVSYDDMSDLDKSGITNAEVEEGMTKDAVKAAWGYPAKHRTPTLAVDRWVYWSNRFKTITVLFEEDKVISVR
ncbi:hypothetical protein H8D64_01675 [PVC group bacterium]|nr:hypothetical protein [PVC group bacterium]